jgi:hypothetical protein
LLSAILQYQFDKFSLLSVREIHYGSPGFLNKNIVEVLVMLDFNSFVGRHGEHGVQAIIEGIERREGIRFGGVSLEERWNTVMRSHAQHDLQAA